MHLEKIDIRQFRCLDRFESELPRGRILVVGDNARGKTTLLEAIYYLVTGRSFRTRYDQDCLPWQRTPDTAAIVRGTVRREAGDSCRIAVAMAQGTKSVRIDDRPIGQLADLWGKLQAALFTPDDLQLIKGSPAERRKYLDICLSQIDHGYLVTLQRYNQALRQRNALLKRDDLSDAVMRREIGPWNGQLEEYGVPILMARFEFVLALEPLAARLYDEIAAANPDDAERTERLRLRYANFLRLDAPTSEADTRHAYRQMLEQGLAEERRRGQTENGPHRDDLGILLSGKPARDFGSQGQTRTCALALRLAQSRHMHAATGERPLLLLDDLASELDPHRKERVLALLGEDNQTFLTTTRREDFPPDSEFAQVIEL